MAAKNSVPAEVPAAHKTIRIRKRDVLRRVKEQVEFYFRDISLRGGFLRARIDESENGFVPIKMVAGFNRVKSITSDVEVVTNAIRQSDVLEVSADGLKVRRSIPLAEPQDIDKRTVYVEDLPPNCSIESLRKDFGKCGAVEYVRLPRYSDSRELKGYAHIMYTRPEASLEAMKMFENFESGLEPLFPPKATTVNTQTSSTSSTAEEGGECEGRRGDMVARVEGQSSRSGRKRPHDSDESSAIDDVKASVTEDDSKTSEPTDDEKLSVKDSPPQAKVKKVEDCSHDEERLEKTAKTSKKRKRTPRKKKPKETKHLYSYKVLHQLEWNRLKKVYLQAQKEEMSRAKKLLAAFRTDFSKPVSPLKTAKASAVAESGSDDMYTRTKRGAAKVLRRLEKSEFLKQST